MFNIIQQKSPESDHIIVTLLLLQTVMKAKPK